MSDLGGKTSRPWEPQQDRQEAQSPEGKRPEGALVFFLLESVPQLHVGRFYAPYERETRGAPPGDPALMGCLLLYAYCVGVLSSRKIALACERPLAFLAMVGAARPDCRTSSAVRTRPLAAFKAVLVQGVRLAAASGLMQLGTMATAGTTIQGKASRHQAMRDGSRKKAVERRREDSASFVTPAPPPDESDDAALGRRRGDDLPVELTRREDRLARLESARRRLAGQAKAEADDERTRRRRGAAASPGATTPRQSPQAH